MVITMFKLSENYTLTFLDSEIVLLNSKTGESVFLNSTASLILEGLLEGREIRQFCLEVAKDYKIDSSAIYTDMLVLKKELCDIGVIYEYNS